MLDENSLEPSMSDRYPIDYGSVTKGTVFTVDQLRRILDCEPGTIAFQLKTLGFRQQLERELWATGKQYLTRIERGAVVVLTDPEASEYMATRFAQHERGLAISHRKLLSVDPNFLDAGQRRAHDRAVAIQGMVLASVLASKARARQVEVRPAPQEGRQLE